MAPPEDLDIGALQAAIERQARQAGPEPPLYQLRLRQELPALREYARVEPNPLLLGRTAYERLWVVINRLVRRVARHGVEPAVIEQNRSNAAVLTAVEQMIALDAALYAEMVRLQAARRRS